MSYTSKGTTEIVVAGLQTTMLVIDLNKGEVTKQVCTLCAGVVHIIAAYVEKCRYQPTINTR